MEKHKIIVDQQQWKQILKQIHIQNIPIQFKKQNLGLAELYANHVPKQLYVKHSYDKLIHSINIYIKQFEEICHKTLQNNTKKYKTLQQHEEIIRLGLQEIIQELGFLNLKPISEIVYLINSLIFRIRINFINFVKSMKKTYFSSNFQRKSTTVKDSINNLNLCYDCKGHREEMFIKDLKRKLNLNKTQALTWQSLEGGNVQQNNNKKTDREKQIDIIHNFTKVKTKISENLQRQEQRQNVWKQKQNDLDKFRSNTQTSQILANDILMNQKQTYIQQLNALLEGREVHETTNTHAYSYLINQLMQFPHLDKLNEQVYAKQAEKITQKIQNQLFQNFMSTLSDPLKQVLRKILGKKYLQVRKQANENEFHKVKKISVEVQTSSISFEDKIKYLEKQLQRKNFQLNYIKQNKQNLQKKYIEKYQEQRQNQKQINENFSTMKDLKRKIDEIMQEKDILHDRMDKQKSYQAITMKKLQTQHEKTLAELRVINEKKYHQYRQRLNKDVENKLKKINEQKSKQINFLKSLSELHYQHELTVNQSMNTLKTIVIGTQNQLINQDLKQSVNIMKKIQSQQQQNKSINIRPFSKRKAYQKPNKTMKNLQNQQNQKISQISLQIKNSYQNSHIANIQNKTNLQKLYNLYQQQNNQFKSYHKFSPLQNQIHSIQLEHKNIQQKKQLKSTIKQDSVKSIDLMIKLHQASNKLILDSQEFKPPNIEDFSQIQFNSNLFKEIHFQNTPNKSQRIRLQRKTTNQFEASKKQKAYLTIQTQKSSPNKQFSTRKFRKINKQVQFAFNRKPFIQQSSQISITHNDKNINMNTQISEDEKEQFEKKKFCNNEENCRKKNDSNLNKTNLNISNKSQQVNLKLSKQKPSTKSSVKFKNIILEESLQKSRNKIKESKLDLSNVQKENVKNKGFKQLKTLQNNKSSKSSYLMFEGNRSYRSFSRSKHEQIHIYDQKQNIWQIQLFDKQYSIDSIKSLIQREFQYFKLTGLIEKVLNLQANEQKQLRNKILTVAKKVILSANQKASPSKSKDPFTKSHQTLKQILSKSMSKINPSNTLHINDNKRKQIQELSEQLFNDIYKINTLSLPTVQDLQLFGGKQNAKKIQLQNLSQVNSSLVVFNTLGQANDLGIVEYFKKLYYLDNQKYQKYINFLRYPISYLNGNISKLIKDQKKDKDKSNNSFDKDNDFLKSTINKIIIFHQKQHNSKCIHIQRFLKKIGFYKYSS